MLTDKLNVETKERELIITRTFDAPPQLMFEMWTKCEHLMNWWGPKEWPMNKCNLDLREGGKWYYCMQGPNPGDEACGLGIYKEIRKHDKLVYEDYFTDKDGNINKNMPGMLITVELHDDNGKTRQVSTSLFDTKEQLEQIVQMGVIEGMSSSMDRLDEYLVQVNKK